MSGTCRIWRNTKCTPDTTERDHWGDLVFYSNKTYKYGNLFKQYKYQQRNYLNLGPSVLSLTQNPVTSTCTHADHYCHSFSFFSTSRTVNLLLPFTANSFWLPEL
jgi:hypothetical protein